MGAPAVDVKSLFVILSASEESSKIPACGRAAGFFAALRMTEDGELIDKNPADCSALVSNFSN